MVKYMAVAFAVAVAVSGGGAVAVAVAGLTKRFFNHIQKDFLIDVWGYWALPAIMHFVRYVLGPMVEFVWMRSDAFACVQTRSDAFGCFQKLSESFGRRQNI